jgi:hypothetical protein
VFAPSGGFPEDATGLTPALYDVRPRQGLVIAMGSEQFSRQHVVDVLRHAGWSDLADEASRTLPDPVDAAHLEAWGIQHGVSYDVLQSRFGGSP